MFGRGQQMGFGPPQTPQIIKTLMIANAAVFIAQLVFPTVSQFGVVSPAAVWLDFELWRPFTYMWLHSPGSFFHIAFNMFALWMFGSSLCLLWGDERFLKYYFVCGIGAGFLIATVPMLTVWFGWEPASMSLWTPTLGASGAVMGCLLAYSFTWPDRTLMLIFPPIPIKAIYLIPLVLVMDYVSGPANVSHLGHLGGVVVGWIYLVNEGRTPGAPTPQTLLLKWRRYQTRQKIRSIHKEDQRERRRSRNDENDHRFH